MLKKIASVLLLAITLSGCTGLKSVFQDRQLTVRVSAKPTTARLYLDGAPVGNGASWRTTIELTPEQMEYGTYTMDIPEVQWPSGTVVPQTTKTLSLNQLSHQVVIQHPDPTSGTGRYDQLKRHSFDVTYKASVPNAQIYLNGELLGGTPVKKTYEASVEDFKRGSITLPAAEARWPSGSVASMEPLDVNLERSLSDRTVELKHPSPGTIAGAFDRERRHSVTVRFYSEPTMALLFSQRDNLGRAPASCTYTYSFADYECGSIMIDPVQARWSSGAITNSGPIEVQLDGSSYEITLIRPEYPGLDIDLEVVCREEERARQAEVEAENQRLLAEHHRQLERIENERLQLEKEKLELNKRQQVAAEKERKELLRLRKLEVENAIKLKKQKAAAQTVNQ